MQIKNYNYDYAKITAIVSDTYQRQYLWIGFEAVDGICKLLKVSANNPEFIYAEVSIVADNIIKIVDAGTYIFAFIDHATNLAVRMTKTAPVTSATYLTRPVGITENVIDAFYSSPKVYCLFPGTEVGTNASVYSATTSTQFSELIDLTTVNNLNSFAIDTNAEIWGVTYDSPSDLIRIYLDGTYQYETIPLG